MDTNLMINKKKVNIYNIHLDVGCRYGKQFLLVRSSVLLDSQGSYRYWFRNHHLVVSEITPQTDGYASASVCEVKFPHFSFLFSSYVTDLKKMFLKREQIKHFMIILKRD